MHFLHETKERPKNVRLVDAFIIQKSDFTFLNYVLNQTGARYLLEFSPPRVSPLLWLDQNLNNTITRLS